MLELGNVLRANYGAWVIKGAYSGLDGLVKVPDDDKAASTIQNLLCGKVDKNRQDIRYANKVISAVQELADSAGDINKKMKAMKDLAEKAAGGDYSKQELAEMQKEFEKLAEQVNDIAGNTEYNGNKLFTADGKNISVSIGNGSNIDIVSKDLSFDIKGLDLTKDAKGAFSAVEAALTKSDYYAGYVNSQAERIGDAVKLIEYEINNAFGIKADDFDTGFAKQVASYAANKTLEDMSALLDAQANVEPARALQLLINDET
jgi:flagellin